MRGNCHFQRRQQCPVAWFLLQYYCKSNHCQYYRCGNFKPRGSIFVQPYRPRRWNDYVKAYVITQAGTAYGAQKTFSTLYPPTVTTDTAIDITRYTATCSGSVRVRMPGGGPIVESGICYSTSPNPTVSNSTVVPASFNGLGSYMCGLIGLTSGTTYYVRAYATNSVGTSYGTQISFVTQ